MRIMLIRPRPSPETIGLQHVMICEPLELEYLCAAVGDLGHKTRIVDMILERGPIDPFLRAHRPEVVAFTGYITHVGIIKAACHVVKTLLPACHTVVGGVHAEVVPSDFQDASIDFIVRSNGTATFRALILALGSGGVPNGLPGLWAPGAPPCEKVASFDGLPPDRSKVARYRSRYYYLFHNPCALIKTSFGCPYECDFCFCRQITDGRYFERALDDVITELQTIPERDIYIVDDNFLVSRTRVLAFCEKLEAAGLDKQFLIYGRADFIAANEEVIARFKRHGLRAVIVGLESCSADELDTYNKQSDTATNERAVRVLARHDVDCYATLILGTDWGREEFRQLGRWLKQLDLTFVNLQPFTPLPGTAPFERYQSRLAIPRDAYEQWDLAHLVVAPGQMSPARYYWNIIRLYQATALRPRHVLRLIRRHGVRANLRMLGGASRVLWQYLRRMIRPGRARES